MKRFPKGSHRELLDLELALELSENGQFEEAKLVPEPVRSAIGDETPYIAPDESYLLFSRWAGGNTWPDIWISVRNADLSWGEPQILDSRVNSSSADNCPCISPDGKYLFFISNRSGEFRIYWVDASILNEYLESSVDQL